MVKKSKKSGCPAGQVKIRGVCAKVYGIAMVRFTEDTFDEDRKKVEKPLNLNEVRTVINQELEGDEQYYAWSVVGHRRGVSLEKLQTVKEILEARIPYVRDMGRDTTFLDGKLQVVEELIKWSKKNS